MNFMTNNGELTKLGKWIKATLDEKKKNQIWLAGKIGVQPPQMSRMMRGGTEVLTAHLNAIADALGKRRAEIYRAAGHIEPVTKKEDLDEGVLFHFHRLPLDEQERWARRIEDDANDYQQRKATRSTGKARAS